MTFNKRYFRAAVWTAAALAPALIPPGAAAERHALIVGGAGGDGEYQKQFMDWTLRLESLLTGKLDFEPERVHRLNESAGEAAGIPFGFEAAVRNATDAADAGNHSTFYVIPERNEDAAPAVPAANPAKTGTLETIERVFCGIAESAAPEDDLYIFLIGHGSYLKESLRFHIPGPDLTAAQLNQWLGDAPARRVVLINAASSSAGFINVLSGEDRVICTATNSVDERNATRFMEFFLQALEDGTADMDRDTRVSVLEACKQAAALTENWYVNQGLIPTEHALLDDNGDGAGARLFTRGDDGEGSYLEPGEPDGNGKRPDGLLADATYLKNYSFPDNAPRELIERYLSKLGEAASLKEKKASLDEDRYYAALESILLEAAKLRLEIRSYAPAEP